MAGKKRTREEAKEIILRSLDDEHLDIIKIADDIANNEGCFCGATSGVDVRNDGGRDERVAITKTCGRGRDSYFTIRPNQRERWSRCVYRDITISVDDGDSADHNVEFSTGGNLHIVVNGRIRST